MNIASAVPHGQAARAGWTAAGFTQLVDLFIVNYE